jgi:predicted HicB family RNase H-like nuclease
MSRRYQPIYVRMPVHRAVKSRAALEGKTLNQLLEEVFGREEEQGGGRGRGKFRLF